MDKQVIVIIGAGPTGLCCALELSRQLTAVEANIELKVLDSRPPPNIQDKSKSKALAIHARSLELLDQSFRATDGTGAGYNALQEILKQKIKVEAIRMETGEGGLLTEIPTNKIQSHFNYVASLPQYSTEQCLQQQCQQNGITIEWLSRVTNVSQTVTSATLTVQRLKSYEEATTTWSALDELVESTEQITASFIVAADGAHSAVRKSLQASNRLLFTGEDLPQVFAMTSCKIEYARNPNHICVVYHPDGLIGFLPEPNNRVRIIAHIQADKVNQIPDTLTLDFFQSLVDKKLPHLNAKLSEPHWLTNYKIRARHLNKLSAGRAFFLGDAAHSHSPMGGQGMNTGFQDAYNLAWKLALVVKGVGKSNLLATYEQERLPVHQALLRTTSMAQKVATVNNSFLQGVRNKVMSTASSFELLTNNILQTTGMLDISYAGCSSSIIAEHNGSSMLPSLLSSPLCTSTFYGGPKAGARALDPQVCRIVKQQLQPSMRFYDTLSATHSLVCFTGTNKNLTTFVDTAKEIKAKFEGKLIKVSLVFQNNTLLGKKKDMDLSAFDTILLDSDGKEQGNAHKAYGANTEACWYIIRPDLYVGFRAIPPNAAMLFDYLSTIFFV